MTKKGAGTIYISVPFCYLGRQGIMLTNLFPRRLKYK